MVGHQWFPWINNPTPGTVLMTSTKQEQELYNESDSKPEWRSLLSDYQNISDSYFTLSKANYELTGDNQILQEHSAWLNEQTKLLNRTSAELMSMNLALSLENNQLMEQIVNLTSTNVKLTQEHDQLVQYTSEEEDKKLNMSQTIKYLVSSNTQLQDEKHRLSETSILLREELFQVEENNQDLLEINDKFQREIHNLSEKMGAFLGDDCEKATTHNMQLQETITELQEENQNLNVTLAAERQEAAERQTNRRTEMDQMMADMHSLNEVYHTLDLYCPVVNQKTKERICKKCPDSWRLFQTKCYYFSSHLLSWSSSKAWCQTHDGDLLIINSEPEQMFIFDTSLAVEQDSRLWIGMTDAEREGEWHWVDGSTVTSDVQYWLSRPGMESEPDDWKLDDPLGEDCGHIDTTENALKSWMDGSCKIPYRWICEKNV
ncbi:C-type lectin domain family 10 member A-like [Scomber japonicus]|uniref:C-type lectin domain family 10 member A-like n=1 Tax=Scomber japonicus TaxID=13676 RepID=UPI0023050828|nr:C-type lectin domain family 10 member A-like [Scomber japonicus]